MFYFFTVEAEWRIIYVSVSYTIIGSDKGLRLFGAKPLSDPIIT